MNWQQLRSTFNAHNRMETLIHMLSLAERRQRRRLLVRGIIRQDHRSRRRRVHFNNNNRDGRRRRLLLFIRIVFFFILLTISIATGLLTFHIHPRYAAPLLFIYQLIILTFILSKPRKRQWIGSV
jgi:hypothetical protein